MIRVDVDAVIERPIEEVFARLVDIPRYNEWMPEDGLFVSCTQDSDGPVGVGTAYTDETRLGPVEGEVQVFEPPHEVVFHYTGRLLGLHAIEGWPGYTLEPQGEAATRVHHHAEARLFGPFKVLQPLIQRIARAERRRTVDALERSLE